MKKKLILISCLLFIGLNILLITNDDGNIKRTVYIGNWTDVVHKNMKDTLNTTGVIDYEEKNLVYLHDDHTSFDHFLVDEGNFVNIGDDLYTYHIKQYNETQFKLERDIATVKQDIDAIKDAIKKAKKQSVEEATLEVYSEMNDESITITQHDSAASLQKEHYVIEKEKELEHAKALQNSLEAQLRELTSGSGTVHVPSPYTGYVTQLSPSLTNPLMTIESEEIHVIGELSENERHLVDLAMEVDIKLEDREDIITRKGIIDFVSNEPNELSLHHESVYPFYVQFTEEEEYDDFVETEVAEDEEDTIEELELLRGYHTHLTITTAESINTPVVGQEYVDHSTVWYMGNNGLLSKRDLKTGIEMGKYVEINDDFIEGDRIAKGGGKHLTDDTPFITRLKPSKSTWKVMFKDGARKRSILIAMLAR